MPNSTTIAGAHGSASGMSVTLPPSATDATAALKSRLDIAPLAQRDAFIGRQSGDAGNAFLSIEHLGYSSTQQWLPTFNYTRPEAWNYAAGFAAGGFQALADQFDCDYEALEDAGLAVWSRISLAERAAFFAVHPQLQAMGDLFDMLSETGVRPANKASENHLRPVLAGLMHGTSPLEGMRQALEILTSRKPHTRARQNDVTISVTRHGGARCTATYARVASRALPEYEAQTHNVAPRPSRVAPRPSRVVTLRANPARLREVQRRDVSSEPSRGMSASSVNSPDPSKIIVSPRRSANTVTPAGARTPEALMVRHVELDAASALVRLDPREALARPGAAYAIMAPGFAPEARAMQETVVVAEALCSLASTSRHRAPYAPMAPDFAQEGGAPILPRPAALMLPAFGFRVAPLLPRFECTAWDRPPSVLGKRVRRSEDDLAYYRTSAPRARSTTGHLFDPTRLLPSLPSSL